MTYRTTRANARLPPKRGIWTTERRQSGVTVGGMSSPSRHAEARRLMFEKVRKPSGSLARRLTAKRKNAFPGAHCATCSAPSDGEQDCSGGAHNLSPEHLR